MNGKPQHHRKHHCADSDTLCTLVQAAKVLGLTKQGAHAVEKRALQKMAAGPIERGVRPEDFGRGA